MPIVIDGKSKLQWEMEVQAAQAQKALADIESKVDELDAKVSKSNQSQAESSSGASEAVDKNTGSWTELNQGLEVASKVWNAVKQQIQETVAAAEEAAVVNAKVDAVIRSQGNSAGVTSQQIDQWALSMSRSSGVEDENIKNAEAMALSLGTLSGKEIPRATQAALDWAAVMGGDVQTNLNTISTVLETGTVPRTLKLSAAMKQQVKDAIDAGDKDKALSIILGELETRYGGAAAKMNDAGTHANNLTNEITNLREEVGKEYLPVIQATNDAMVVMIQNIEKWQQASNDNLETQRSAEAILEVQGLTMDNHRRVTLGLTMATQAQVTAAQDEARAQLQAKDAIDQSIPCVDTLAAKTEDLSKKNQDLVGLTEKLASTTDSFNKKNTDLIAKQSEIKQKLDDALKQGWAPTSQKVQDLQGQYDDYTQKIQDNATEYDRSTAQILIDLEKQKLMADGTFSDMDMQIVLHMEHAAGIVDDKTMAMSKNFDDVAIAIASGKLKADDFDKTMKMLEQGYSIDVIIKETMSMSSALDTYYGGSAGKGGKRAMGGPAGGSMWVGEFGPEKVDLPEGSYVHNAQSSAGGMGGGVVINLVINSAVSLADQRQAEDILLPAIESGVRKMQAEGRL